MKPDAIRKAEAVFRNVRRLNSMDARDSLRLNDNQLLQATKYQRWQTVYMGYCERQGRESRASGRWNVPARFLSIVLRRRQNLQ